ncbi:MAG: PLDc N-terminal domain-containing protein [Actinobacteria bacterium]|nr:PLDc N-terminal domain-containing protein [Actinomycetota bacterium]
MLATFAVGQVLWSMLWFFLFVMWIMLIFSIIGDLFRDHETSGGMKVLWIILLFVLPFLGAFLYLIIRGKGMAERSMAQAKAQDAAVREYVQAAAGTGSGAAELQRLADLKASGAITDEEFAKMKAKVIG